MKVIRTLHIWHILSAAFLLRLVFMLFAAEMFYGKEHFYITDDTKSFWYPIHNLIQNNLYTIKIGAPGGEFARMPGFPFYLLPFYIILGDDLISLFRTLAIFQLFLDVTSIWLIYKSITRFKFHKNAALITASLVALYPFSIVWVPIGQAECLSIFIISLALYVYSGKAKFKRDFWLGVIIAAGFLVRPQVVFLLPSIALAEWMLSRQRFFKTMTICSIGFMSLYIWWPLRNLVNHDKVVLTRDISTMRDWQDDVIYFQKYMNSMQVGWEPQMTQIIHYKEVTFPEKAFHSPDIEKKLKEAVWRSRVCSDGFATFRYKTPLKFPCTNTTAKLWKDLYQDQIKADPIGHYLVVPLKALRKGLFKISMVENWKSPQRSAWQKFAYTSLFSFRSLLILLGLFSCFKLLRMDTIHKRIAYLVLAFVIIWYSYLAFGIRFMEMRYLLQADFLLLLPLGIFIISKSTMGSQLS